MLFIERFFVHKVFIRSIKLTRLVWLRIHLLKTLQLQLMNRGELRINFKEETSYEQTTAS
jgi:hypothetical protein